MASVRGLASRSVHLKIYPYPTRIRESREILRVLERFGEVTMFKSLRFLDENPVHNAALAIFKTPESASALRKASPVRFALEPIPGDDRPAATARAAVSGTKNDTAPSPPSPEPSPSAPREQAYELAVNMATQNHQQLIERNPFYAPFRLLRTAVFHDLQKSAPLLGLADTNTDRHLPRDRTLRKLAEVARTRKSLRQIYEEGAGARKA